MLNFVCLKAGNVFGPEYVNLLRDMVLRNLSIDTIDRFICITDDRIGLDDGIEIIDLPSDLETWWGKLYMFKKDLFTSGDRMVFMDLDTVITGRLDTIFKYQGKLAALRDFYKPSELASGILLWEAGSQTIWEDWEADGKPRNEIGDQWWIGKYQADFLQDLYPNKFVSFKGDCQISPPSDAAVICFHGLPRPHQIQGWISNFWKIGGYSSSDFDVVCNTELSKVVDNIKFSSSLNLPVLELKKETGRPILFCGGGPSLRYSLEEIKQEQQNGALVVGLNGSAQYLKDNGIDPDWLVMIDARESNIEFIVDNPAKRYFLSSQCSPSIFTVLEKEDNTLFHIDIPNIGEYVPNNGKEIQAVGGGSSVGLIALSVAYTYGYRNMHLYGYDSSFTDGEGHAYKQDQEDEIIEVSVVDKTFKSTPWMVTQSTQWQQLAKQLRQLGCSVTVHGDGLLPYIAWVTMLNEQSVSERDVDIRARELLKRIPPNAIGAEIGVFAGELSARLLSRGDIKLKMIDSWTTHENSPYVESNDFHSKLTQEQQDNYKKMAFDNTEFASDRREILHLTSEEASKLIPDESLDFIFIDADHSYEGCKTDIALWYKKVKKGGMISGHDYSNPYCPGFEVNRAVDEFIKASGMKLELGENFTWFAIPVESPTSV